MTRNRQALALIERARLIYQLRNSTSPGATALADVLTACKQMSCCQSAACPVCGLAFQRVAADIVGTFIDAPARAVRGRMTALTIIPEAGCVRPDALATDVFRHVGNQITTAFSALGLPAAITGLEASFNEDCTNEVEPHWCVHGHGLQRDWLSAAQVAALKQMFPRSQFVKRPVMCVPLDHNQTGRIYPFKPERFRRVTRWISNHPQRRPYRDTKSRHLRPSQAVGLAIAEHELGFGGRLLVHAIDEKRVEQHLIALGWGINASKR